MKKKIIAIALCAALAVGGVVAGSIAWLQDETQDVINTFTAGDIHIELEESGTTDNGSGADVKSYDMIPGYTLSKDPKVTVKADSEKCYLFVQVTEVGGEVTVTDKDHAGHKFTGEGENKVYDANCNFKCFLSYQMAAGWNSLEGNPGVYYREVDASSANQEFSVLLNDKITVNSDVTNDMMHALKDTANAVELPKLTFKAYAHQYMKNETQSFTAAEAWANLNA